MQGIPPFRRRVRVDDFQRQVGYANFALLDLFGKAEMHESRKRSIRST
jgi:hypothetical protein